MPYLEANQGNVSRAKAFLVLKWKERASELGRPEPADLSTACKFASAFAQSIFGGLIRGNKNHQYLEIPDGSKLDLTDNSNFELRHDPTFFGNPEHRESMQSIKPRVDSWVKEFMGSKTANEITFSLGDFMRQGVVKVAMPLPELVKETNNFSTKNSPGCLAKLTSSKPGDLFLEYNVKCDLKTSDPAGHTVCIRFDTSQVTDETKANKLDVRTSCSCVAPNTMIRLVDGREIPIPLVRIGDVVITHKGRGREVTAVHRRTAKPGEIAWEMKATGYRDALVTSSDHPLAVVRGHELCACGCGEPLYPMGYNNMTIRQRWARKFVKGHYRRGEAFKDLLSEGAFNWKKPFELVKREQLYFPITHLPFSTQVEPNFARLLGYYLAEGHVIVRPFRQSRWGCEVVTNPNKSLPMEIEGVKHRVGYTIFTLNQNERGSIAEDIQNIVKLLYGNTIPVEIKDHESDGDKWMTVTVKCPELSTRLISLGSRTSAGKRLSNEILSWDREAIINLITGYAMGDGYVSDDSQSVFSISRDLITQMSTLLFGLGIWHGFTYQTHKRKQGKSSLSYRLNWNYREFPEIVEKMHKYMRVLDLNRSQERLIKETCRGDSRDKFWGPGFIRSLLSKKQVAAPEEFYDLTVAEDESFIANGIVVHNCPAFLYWGAQWALHQRDSLEGEPRPLLTAPTERLDLRGKFVLCKHVYTVSSRILPAVQNNINTILRKRRVEEATPAETPDRLKGKQDDMRKRQELKKLRDKRNKSIQKNLLDGVRKREEEPNVIKRDEPSTPEEKAKLPNLVPEPIVSKPNPPVSPAPEPTVAPVAKKPVIKRSPVPATLSDSDRKNMEKLRETENSKTLSEPSPVEKVDDPGGDQYQKKERPGLEKLMESERKKQNKRNDPDRDEL